MGFVGGQLGHGGRRGRDAFAEDAAGDPVAAFDRAGAQAGGVHREEDRHRQQTAASVVAGVVDADPGLGCIQWEGDAVMPREGRVDEGVGGVEEVGEGAVGAQDVVEEADGFLEHGLAQGVVEGGEADAVDGVVFLEAAEVEPVAAELDGESADAVVLDHALRLGGEDFGTMQGAGIGTREQGGIRRAGPEEVAEAVGEGVIGERHGAGGRAGLAAEGEHATCGLRGRLGVRGFDEVEPIEEMGRHQQADDAITDGVLVAEAVACAQRAVEVEQVGAFGGGEWATPGAGGEGQERVELAGFGFGAQAVDAAEVGGGALEVFLHGGKDGFGGADLAGLGEVGFSQLADLGLGGAVLVLGTGEVEDVIHQEAAFGALKPDEARVHPVVDLGNEFELGPEAVEFAALGVVEDEVVERGVVAEESGHAVEAGAQQAADVGLVLAGFEEDAGTFGDEEGVREQGAEPGEARLDGHALGGVGGNGEVGIRCLGFRVLRFRLWRAHAFTGRSRIRNAAVDVEQAGIEAAAVGGHLAVLPEDEALGAGIDAGCGEVADLGHELPAQGEHRVPEGEGAFVGEFVLASGGNGQGAELCLESGDGTDLFLRVVERIPDLLEVGGAESGRTGDVRERGAPIPEGSTMLETPGGLEVDGEVGGLPAVEIHDAQHRVLVAVGVDQHRVRREGQALRGQDDGVGDLTGGLEVFLQEGRRHRQRFAGVVEALAVGRVDGELARGAQVNAGDVADGVIVFGVAEAPGEDRAGIPSVVGGLALAEVVDPADDPGGLGRRRMLLRLARWHFARLELVEDHGPPGVVGDHARDSGEGAEVEVGLRFVGAVAFEAVGADEGADGGGEGAVEGIGGGGTAGCRKNQGGTEQPDQSQGMEGAEGHRGGVLRRTMGEWAQYGAMSVTFGISVFLEDEAVVDALRLVVFERREIGVGGRFGLVEQGLGEFLELAPAIPLERGGVGDLAEQGSPFDDDAVDVAVAEEVGHVPVLAVGVTVDGVDDEVGAVAVLGRDAVLEVAFDVLVSVLRVAGDGEAATPPVVVAAEAESGVEVGEVVDEFVERIRRLFEGGGDGEADAALEEADDAPAEGGHAALVDQGESAPEQGRAGGGGEVAADVGERAPGAIGREDLALGRMPEADAMAIDWNAEMEVLEGDDGDDLLWVDVEAEDRRPFGREVGLDQRGDGAVPGLDGRLAAVPCRETTDPLGKDHAIGAEAFGHDEGTAVDGAVRRFGDLGETAGADLVEGGGNGEDRLEARGSIEGLAGGPRQGFRGSTGFEDRDRLGWRRCRVRVRVHRVEDVPEGDVLRGGEVFPFATGVLHLADAATDVSGAFRVGLQSARGLRVAEGFLDAEEDGLGGEESGLDADGFEEGVLAQFIGSGHQVEERGPVDHPGAGEVRGLAVPESETLWGDEDIAGLVDAATSGATEHLEDFVLADGDLDAVALVGFGGHRDRAEGEIDAGGEAHGGDDDAELSGLGEGFDDAGADGVGEPGMVVGDARLEELGEVFADESALGVGELEGIRIGKFAGDLGSDRLGLLAARGEEQHGAEGFGEGLGAEPGPVPADLGREPPVEVLDEDLVERHGADVVADEGGVATEAFEPVDDVVGVGDGSAEEQELGALGGEGDGKLVVQAAVVVSEHLVFVDHQE